MKLNVSGVPFLSGANLPPLSFGKERGGSMKKLALILIILFSLASIAAVTADDNKLQIEYTPIKDHISYKETAVFNMEITNPLYVSEEVYVTPIISDWEIHIPHTRMFIPAKETRSTTISLTPPLDIRPGKYVSCFTFKGLKFNTISNHRCIFIIVTDAAPMVEDPEGKPEVVIEDNVLDKFMVSTHIVTIKNVGTKRAEGEFTAEFELLSSFFVTSSPLSNGIRTIPEGKEFYWLYSLAPGESTELSYSMSFFPLILSISIVIISLIFLLSFYASGLKIDKKLLIPSRGLKGPKSVKVKLSVKNNTNKEFKKVDIEDFVPTPFKLTDNFGTLKPSVVKKQQDRVKLVWRLDLAPREERLISYSFKSKLKVIGKIMLPRARIVYGDKKKTAVYSGILIVKGHKEERLE